MSIPIDPHYIPAFSIEDVLLDKDTGAPMSGGQVWFEEDNQRNVLKPIYQITGTSPNYTFTQLPNPMTLSSIGTFEDALGNPVIPYFYPYAEINGVLVPDLYYIEVFNSGGVPQFDRQAQPYLGEQDDGSVLSVITNELSNPQFVEVNFDTTSTSYTYNFNNVISQEVDIAPDWALIVTAPSTGSVTVRQLAPQGQLNIPTNPATLLTINSAGLTQLILRQRIYGSPNLWGNGYISGTFVAKTYSGTTVNITMYYSQSGGTVQNQPIVTGMLPSSGAYQAFPGSSALIPISNSPDSFPNAYIDIYFVLPLSIKIDITSVMVSFTGLAIIPDLIYSQESEARQIDHLFHYYQSPLNFKPISSLLVGWDFALNPAQQGTAFTAGTTPIYTWDQTIIGSAVGNLTVARNNTTGGISITTSQPNEAFFLLQYLNGAQALKTTLSNLAVNIDAYATTNPNSKVNIYLYYSSNNGTIPTGTITAPGIIGVVTYSSGNAVFTLTGAPATTWALIPQALGEASSSSVPYNMQLDAGFSGFNGGVNYQSASTTQNFAIVVAFGVPTSGTVININSISCVPGDIPTRPAPQAADEVLRECQYYYEKSYDNGVVPGTASSLSSYQSAVQNAETISLVNLGLIATILTVNYNTVKCAIPDGAHISFYSPVTGTSNRGVGALYNNAAQIQQADFIVGSFYNVTMIGSKSLLLIGKSASAMVSVAGTATPSLFGFIAYHYTINTQLGTGL